MKTSTTDMKTKFHLFSQERLKIGATRLGIIVSIDNALESIVINTAPSKQAAAIRAEMRLVYNAYIAPFLLESTGELCYERNYNDLFAEFSDRWRIVTGFNEEVKYDSDIGILIAEILSLSCNGFCLAYYMPNTKVAIIPKW